LLVKHDMEWDRTTDVIVVGSGPAAYSAALSASSTGCEVLMLEKAAESGGTTQRIQHRAQIWIPNNAYMRVKNISDPRDMALKYMAKLAQPLRYEPDAPTLGLSEHDYSLIAAFYDHGSEAINALVEAGALDTAHDAEQPDYSAEFPENVAPLGRCICPKAVHDPAAELGNGPDLMAQLHSGAVRHGIELLLEHDVRECISIDDAIVGVAAVHAKGTMRVRARRGIVFGTGGFLHNPDLCDEFLRCPIFGGCAVSTNTGALVSIASPLGAAFDNMTQAWWSEVVLELALENRSVPSTVWMPGGDAMILVNRHGRRVVNEKMPYNERGQVHYQWDAAAGEFPNRVLFCLFDDSVAQMPAHGSGPMRHPVPLPGENPPWVISGASWDELAAKIKERLEGIAQRTGGYRLADGFVATLKDTIRRFDGFAAQGRDLDFHRGETPIQLHWGGTGRPGNERNPTMFPFSARGPYHAVMLGGGAIDTKGGPKTDSNGRVLDRAGNAIPGLFGAGNCVASPAGRAYWGPGGTLGPALVFGYLAGKAAAAGLTERSVRQPD
jgi:3-oxosteroid 1-dehydrogenase